MTDELTYLECPCCGGDGAVSDAAGYFHDEQDLICGCIGHVCVEEDGDVWINAYECYCDEEYDHLDDEPCP